MKTNNILLIIAVVSVIMNIILFQSLNEMSKRAAYHLKEQTRLEKLIK